MHHTEGSLSLKIQITKLQKSEIVYIGAPEEHSQHSCFYADSDFHGEWLEWREGIWINDNTQSVPCVKSHFVVAIISGIHPAKKLRVYKREALVKCVNFTAKHKRWTNSKYVQHPSRDLRHAEWKLEKRKHFWLISFKANKRLSKCKGRLCLHPKRRHSTSNSWHQGPTVEMPLYIHMNMYYESWHAGSKTVHLSLGVVWSVSG